MSQYSKDQTVHWKWGNGTVTAVVQDIRTDGQVSITSHGKEIHRNASTDNPVYILKQDDGTKIIKHESELT